MTQPTPKLSIISRDYDIHKLSSPACLRFLESFWHAPSLEARFWLVSTD